MNDYTNNSPKPTSLCHVCGLLGDKTCGQCHQASYCSKEHQKIHWSFYNHREHCGLSKTIHSPTILFKELELVSEEEPDETTQLIQDSLQNLSVAPVSHFIENVKEIELEEDAEDSQVNVDKAFLKFQKKMLLEPEQVMRYDRHFDSNEPVQGPLWANDFGIPTIKDIPPCPHCHSHRSFEFQLTPQLLHYLNIVDASKDSIDFGTLVIYTCSKDCMIKSNEYVEEILWKQDFSNDGLWKPQEK
jgi:pre-rRNA-processing protein TSR4